MEWQCGYCKYENRRTTLYSFLYKCQKCDKEPKTFLCPHCGASTSLDADDDTTHPAVYAPRKAKPALAEDPREEKRKAHAELKEDKERAIELAELDAKHVAILAAGQSKKVDTSLEKMETMLTEYIALVAGGEMAAIKVRRKLAEDYKDNPELLKKLDKALTRRLEETFL